MRAPVLARATPAFAAASGWMAARSRREQVLIAVAGGFFAVVLLWMLILRPLLDMRENSIARIAAYEQVMVRVRTGGPPTGPAASPLSAPLETAIPTQAAPFGIVPASVTPEGEAAVVTLADARYDSVVPWLAGLEATGATLTSVRIDRGTQPGLVDVSVRVEP